jgi:hypothetical protein
VYQKEASTQLDEIKEQLKAHGNTHRDLIKELKTKTKTNLPEQVIDDMK